MLYLLFFSPKVILLIILQLERALKNGTVRAQYLVVLVRAIFFSSFFFLSFFLIFPAIWVVHLGRAAPFGVEEEDNPNKHSIYWYNLFHFFYSIFLCQWPYCLLLSWWLSIILNLILATLVFFKFWLHLVAKKG